MTTRDDVKQWFDKGVADGQRFMLVYCDTYDYEDYPIYAKDAPEFWKILGSDRSMQKLMEVYDLTLNEDNQLDEPRANHYPEER